MKKLTIGQKFLSDKTGNIMTIDAISGSGRIMVSSSDESKWSAQENKFLEFVNNGKYTEVVEEKELNKKEFQKVIKKIRDQQPKISGTYSNSGRTYCYKDEYPKAMMTAKQINNRTATINCGGSHNGMDQEKVNKIMENEDFKNLMKKYNCSCIVEILEGCKQLRIRY